MRTATPQPENQKTNPGIENLKVAASITTLTYILAKEGEAGFNIACPELGSYSCAENFEEAIQHLLDSTCGIIADKESWEMEQYIEECKKEDWTDVEGWKDVVKSGEITEEMLCEYMRKPGVFLELDTSTMKP